MLKVIARMLRSIANKIDDGSISSNPYSEEAAILSGETAMQILNEALYNIAEL